MTAAASPQPSDRSYEAAARVVVFARVPAPGRVKTRLAGAVGLANAARLAAAFLLDTWTALRKVNWLQAVVATTGPLEGALKEIDTWDQGRGDLGQRMERCLRRALADAKVAIALGGDTPGLPGDRLEQARAALLEADAVLGCCPDGGFYLLGLRRCPEGLLEGLPWSREDTYERVRERLRSRGLTVATIEPWFDVDRPSDLARLEALIDSGAVTAPETSRVIRSLAENGHASPRAAGT